MKYVHLDGAGSCLEHWGWWKRPRNYIINNNIYVYFKENKTLILQAYIKLIKSD